MNTQSIIRVPASHRGRFYAMLLALGGATPAALVALLVEYADTPEGGKWLRDHFHPAPRAPRTLTPEPISWALNSSPIDAPK